MGLPEDYIDRFLEVLDSTFSACDEEGSGHVETSRLIDFLIAQEPSWLNNERVIKEEFHKILHVDLNYMISKEDFKKSLRGWIEASYRQVEDVQKEEKINSDSGKCSSSTSCIEEPLETSSESRTNSVEEIFLGINFDEQTFTNEDIVDGASLNDSGGSQAERRSLKLLQSEISTLLRKNEYLESIHDSLLSQVSCLEDANSKKQDELEDYKKQLIKSSNRLELEIQKYEETEERINLVTEENKSISIQLSQFERENAKLKSIKAQLEEKLEQIMHENTEKTTKLEEMTNKFNNVNNLFFKSMEKLAQEEENFRCKEEERENAWREVITENMALKSQADSNNLYIEDLKCKIRSALEELSRLQSIRMNNVMESDVSSSSFISTDNSVVRSDKADCCCVCKQNLSLKSRNADTVHVAVGTAIIETEDKSTITVHNLKKGNEFSNSVVHKDVGVECSLKETLEYNSSSTFCLLKSRRSIKKWASLFGVILFLCLLLVFFSFLIICSTDIRSLHKTMFYYYPLFEMFHVQVNILNTFLPTK